MSVWHRNGGERRIEVYFGSSNAGGLYTIAYANPFPAGKSPAVIPAMIGAVNTRIIRVTASSETGFTVMVEERTVTTVLGIQLLASAATVVNGQSVCVTVIEDD